MPVDTLQIRLWSDEPSAVDLLAFQAVAETAVDAVLDDALDPLALGVSGRWGSGKTTVLRLIEHELTKRGGPDAAERLLVVKTDPWRYDPVIGAKETLIGEVLAAIGDELKTSAGIESKARGILKKLAKRVDWAKALRMTARASLTLQLPSVDDLTSLIRDGEAEEDGEVRGLAAFREEFARLLASEDLSYVKRVVVLVDDLDRCLPETVVETLEAIRLFLAVPKMSFVLAADEDRVADAIRGRYPKAGLGADLTDVMPQEEPAKLYLHKIVQTTIPLPALSRFDTEAYLLLLQMQNRVDNILTDEQFQKFVGGCGELRLTSGDLDDLVVPDGVDITEELTFAARLTPMLYEKLRGNPRRIKRFLNDLYVRQAIAVRRGIKLETAVVAKLMVLELLLPDEFAKVLEWLANGELRDQIGRLEKRARRGDASDQEESAQDDGAVEDKTKKPKPLKKAGATPAEPEYGDNFLRWSKLPPDLADLDLSPYLHLAASFAGEPLLDRDLPERLRDLAANLLSSVRAEQKSVTDGDLTALTTADAVKLVQHLGRMGRDRPGDQRKAVNGLLRIFRAQPAQVEAVRRALLSIPADQVQISTVLLFNLKSDVALRPVLDQWKAETSKQTVSNAVDEVLRQVGAA